jgi:hypothetical protein
VKKTGCFIRDSTKGLSDGFNKCFNKKTINQLNEYRLQHKDQGSRLLKLNEKAAQFLHKEMNLPHYAFTRATAANCKKSSVVGYVAATNYCLETVIDNHETYKNCNYYQYSEDSTKKMMDWPVAYQTLFIGNIKTQYDRGMGMYDFTKNTYKSTTNDD